MRPPLATAASEGMGDKRPTPGPPAGPSSHPTSKCGRPGGVMPEPTAALQNRPCPARWDPPPLHPPGYPRVASDRQIEAYRGSCSRSSTFPSTHHDPKLLFVADQPLHGRLVRQEKFCTCSWVMATTPQFTDDRIQQRLRHCQLTGIHCAQLRRGLPRCQGRRLPPSHIASGLPFPLPWVTGSLGADVTCGERSSGCLGTLALHGLSAPDATVVT